MFLRLPHIQWLGALPSDSEKYDLPQQCLLPLTAEDKTIIEAMLQRCYLQIEAPLWRLELESLLRRGVKFEIEALSVHSLSFLSEEYLSAKIQEGPLASMEAVVVDAGSRLLKAGFAIPDQAPSMIIPTQMKCLPEDDLSTDNALLEESTVDPVVRGFIKDWDAMEDLLHHVLYNGLGWEMGNEGQILFTDPLSTPKAVREQLVQLMFETFNISGFYASEQAVLSLYAVGRISGCTVDIGHGKIDIAPVIEGAVHHIASRRLEIGGAELTKLLAQELGKSNPLVKLDNSDVERLKELYGCCAEDDLAYKKIQQSCQEEQHTLPDGQVIKIGRERYTVGEALFQPSILGLESHGIVEQLVRSISAVSSENHRQLLENTVLCGGTVSMAGFEDRFQKEASLCSSAIRPSLVKAPEYMPENLTMCSAWVGGAILAKVVFPQNQHITKADYDETGPSVVHRKCF